MPRFNIKELFRVETPLDELDKRRETIVKALLKFEEVDKHGYDALMDMFETEVRGLFYQFLDPTMPVEKVIEHRNMAMGILRLVQLIEIQKGDFDKAEWLKKQEEEFANDEEKINYAQRMSLRRED